MARILFPAHILGVLFFASACIASAVRATAIKGIGDAVIVPSLRGATAETPTTDAAKGNAIDAKEATETVAANGMGDKGPAVVKNAGAAVAVVDKAKDAKETGAAAAMGHKASAENAWASRIPEAEAGIGHVREEIKTDEARTSKLVAPSSLFEQTQGLSGNESNQDAGHEATEGRERGQDDVHNSAFELHPKLEGDHPCLMNRQLQHETLEDCTDKAAQCCANLRLDPVAQPGQLRRQNSPSEIMVNLFHACVWEPENHIVLGFVSEAGEHCREVLEPCSKALAEKRLCDERLNRLSLLASQRELRYHRRDAKPWIEMTNLAAKDLNELD